MKMLCCAVRDSELEAYMQPMFFAARGQATRSFGDAINNRQDQSNAFARHPEHYKLFLLAEFDDATGLFEASSDMPLCLARGVDVLMPEGR